MSSTDGVDDRSLAFTGSGAGTRWLSFHVHLAGSIDQFLVDYLASRLEQECLSGSVSRFFFIRYHEGGLHLRLRFLPEAGREPEIAKWVAECVNDFAQSGADEPDLCKVEQHTYDRGALYFGNTIHSVYAELLNEQTSWLALRLLRRFHGNRAQLMLVLAAALDHLLLQTAEDHAAYLKSLHASLQFAADTAREYGVVPQPPNQEETGSFCAVFTQVQNRSASFLAGDRNIAVMIRLMLRLRRSQSTFVAVHALHLLCNKLGFSLLEEYQIFSLLASINKAILR
jgi:thiopeptide-type bacteriocin biosynthesis protein